MREKKEIPKKPTKPKANRGEAGEYVESMKAGAAKWGIPVHVMKIAKAAGCPAFSGSRIRRAELEAWLDENPKARGEGEMAATEAELKRRKLQNDVSLGDVKNDKEKRNTIPLAEAKAEWGRAASIVQEEANQLMERDHYRVFVERCKSRIGEILEE